MKMSAEFACGQILFNLKNSNLHYLIKETPMSAYITVRKKFIRDIDEETKEDSVKVTDNRIGDKPNILDGKIRMENGLLKQEINDLKSNYANLEIENDVVELKNKELNETVHGNCF